MSNPNASILTVVCVTSALLASCAAPDVSAEKDGTSRVALTQEINGTVDSKAYPLDNPAVIAQSADGKTYAAPLAADGSFTFHVERDASYRLVLANSVGPGLFYAISHIQWHHEGGFSEWASCREGGGAIALGTIQPMTQAEASSCASCKGMGGGAGASAGAQAGAHAAFWGKVGGSASAHYGASVASDAEGGGLLGRFFGHFGASVNVDVSASASADAEASAEWDWVGAAQWNGTWGASGAGAGFSGAEAASVSFGGAGSAAWQLCDELDATAHLNFSSSNGIAPVLVATGEGSSDAQAKLVGACGSSAYQVPPAPSPPSPFPVGSACSFNAQCGASAFCASSKCVASEPSLVH